MAALFLHNAIFVPEPSDSSQENLHPHTRTVSSATLRTITTDQSHPTEPLLHASNSGSLAYQDLLSIQPGYEESPGVGLSFDAFPPTSEEKQIVKERSVRKRLRILKFTGFVLTFILGIWALYNTIRYFIAYTIYDSSQGQTVALVLGTSTAICVAFLTCASIVSAFKQPLIRLHIPIHSLLVLRSALRYLGSFFLLSPAIVNLVLTVVWRNSSIPELVPELHCRLDVDAIWSVTTERCNRTTTAQWLGLAIFRVVFTLLLVASFLLISSAYNLTRRPSQSSKRRKRRRRRMQSESSIQVSPPPTSASTLQHPLLPTPPSRNPSFASQGNRLNSERSIRSSGHSSFFNQSSSSSDEGEDFLPVPLSQTRSNSTSPPATNAQSDRDLNNFADRFRVLVSQISRETEEALQFAQSDAADDEAYLPPEDIYTSLPQHRQHTHNDDYGYPPDDHIRILNGVVRRMPTIESLGSRELASLSSYDRLTSISRPPTDFSGSDPPSRANSLSLAAAIGGHGVTTTEVGELTEHSGDTTGTGSTSPSTFLSYYTAQSNGRVVDSPAPLTPTSDHFPSSIPSPLSSSSHRETPTPYS